MEAIGVLVGLFYFLGFVAAIGLLIYFIVKRVEDKSREQFEKRRN